MQHTVQELLDQFSIDYTENSTHFKCKCLNKYHDDSSPSFYIRKDDGLFHCFGCKIKGNYNQLYKLITGNNFIYDSSQTWSKPTLKSIVHVEDPEIEIIGSLKDPLKNTDIRKYLHSIGIYSDTFIKDRNITYSVYSEMIAKHLMSSNVPYTKMRERITIPIYKKDKLINVEGRIYIPKEEQLEGTPKTLYVRGGSTQYLYNWDYIDLNSDIVLVEGIKDFFKVWNIYSNTVSMFHNFISESQAELLNQCKGNIIVFIDNDVGGWGSYDENGKLVRDGTLQSCEQLLNKEFKFTYHPKEGKDPNDCSLKEIDILLSKAKYYNSSYIEEYIDTLKIPNW